MDFKACPTRLFAEVSDPRSAEYHARDPVTLAVAVRALRRRPPLLKRVLPLVILLLAASAPTVRAATWIAPQHPLTDTEWLEYDISGADAIGIGCIVAIHDSIVDVAADRSGIPTRALSLRVTKWLKGAPGSAALRVGVSVLDAQPLRGEDLSSIARSDRKVAIMLRRLTEGWGLADGPDPGGPGMRVVPPGKTRDFERQLRTLIARQNVDSVLARAELVVVGRCVDSAPCSPTNGHRCARVVVEQALAGAPASDTISVFTPLVGDIPTGRAVFFVRSVPGDGCYETVGFQAGCQSFDAERARRWGLSIDDIRSRLRRDGRAVDQPPR